MLVLGPTGASPEATGTPATTRFANVEPSALLTPPLAVRLLTTLAMTSSAVINPLRMLMFAAGAGLCPPASAVPLSPDVMLLGKKDARVPGTFWVLPLASASAPSGPEAAGPHARRA